MELYLLSLGKLEWKMKLHTGKVYEPEEMLKSNKFYEPNIMRECFKLLDKDTIFVDIGANMGVFSLPACQLCKNVIAIDPDIDRCLWIAENGFINQIDNLQTINLAIADYEGKGYTGCNMSPSLSGRNFRFSTDKNKYSNSKMTRVNKLDNIFIEKDKYVVKIDVEGSEYLVLNGMEQMIKDNPNIKIVCEVHEKMMKDIFNITLDDFNKLLDKLNLKKTKLEDTGLHYLLEVK